MTKLFVGNKIISIDFSYTLPSQASFLNIDTPVLLVDKEIGSHNLHRSLATFVIEQITMEGGSDRDSIPAEPFIIARRLDEHNKYDENGELIAFFHGKFHGAGLNIHVVGKMKRIFV